MLTFYMIDHYGFPKQKEKEQHLAAEQIPSILIIRKCQDRKSI